MKLGIFNLVVGIFVVVVVLVAVVLLLSLFYHKYRKKNIEVREQTTFPKHHDARMTTIELHPTSKVNSGVPPPLLPSNEETSEFGVSVSSSSTHSSDMSELRYSDVHLTDTVKKEMLHDPFVTTESKEMVKKELAENEKLLKNSAGVSVPTFKMNSGVHPPLLPSNEVTDELGVSIIHSLDMSEHRYSEIQSTDTMKREILQDLFVTAESKEMAKKELAESEKLLKYSARASVPTFKMNSGVHPPLLPSNEVTDELGVSIIHSLDMSEHRYSEIQSTDTMKREILQDPFITAESKDMVKIELAENEKLLKSSARVSVAQNEEEGKLLAEIDNLH